MKVIGPYVISATPLGTASGGQAGSAPRPPVATLQAVPGSVPLHGVDRLTGMPVLLHHLPEYVLPGAVPESPDLLPVTEVDVWDAQPYAVTELPISALLATHPATAAPGVLRALAALHRAGVSHGAVHPSQFWQVGRDVRLAGAGLPWAADATPQGDMRALAAALDSLGPRPTALKGLEELTAPEALARLTEAGGDTSRAGQSRTAPVPVPEAAPDPVAPAPLQAVSPPALRTERAGTPAPSTALPPSAPPLPPVPVPSAAPAPEDLPLQSTPAAKRAGRAAKPQERRQAQERLVPTPRHETPLPESAADAAMTAAVRPPETVPVAPATVIPPVPDPVAADVTPTVFRAPGDVIVIGDPLPEGPPQTPAPTTAGQRQGAPSIPDPIRIGFEDEELPEWTPDDAASVQEPGEDGGTDAPGTPPAPGGAAGRPARFTPASSPTLTGAAPPAVPRPALSADAPGRGQPFRIGWEEDHSWRVVKPGPPTPVRERRPANLPLIAGVVLVLLLGAFWVFGRGGTPSGACCSQAFTVTGRERVTVTLVHAPPGSALQPGAVVGSVPGTLQFPGPPGQYTLKFSAPGHDPQNGTVTVPSGAPFPVALK
ncbi:hypothetical protein [Deinococcus aquiradiocola]|nr:hypothetical protein [Deinococcus aquiradiocola]